MQLQCLAVSVMVAQTGIVE